MPLTAGQQIGVGAAQSAFNTIGSLISAPINNAISKSLAKYQNDLAIKNWQMQNEYNLPVNQVQRLRDAGLNPYLMYGNGSASTGNAGQISSPTVANNSRVDIDTDILGKIMQYQNVREKGVTVDNLKKQGDLLGEEIANKQFQNLILEQDSLVARATTSYRIQQEWQRLRKMQQDYDNSYFKNNREERLAKSQIQAQEAKVKQMEQDSRYLAAKTRWQNWYNNQMKQGINPLSTPLDRVIGSISNKLGITGDSGTRKPNGYYTDKLGVFGIPIDSGRYIWRSVMGDSRTPAPRSGIGWSYNPFY